MCYEFTVIMPAYNAESTIYAAVASVLAQSFKGFELIVVDNSSTDNTKKKLEGFDDARLKILDIQNNGIISRSRNLGIDNARGKYIAFIDADDEWDEKKLEVCRRNMASKQILVHAENWRRRENGQFIRHVRYGSSTVRNLAMVVLGNVLSTSAVCVSRRDLEGFKFPEDEDLVGIEDYCLWVMLWKSGFSIKSLPDRLGTFYLSQTSTSGNIEWIVKEQNSLGWFLKYGHISSIEFWAASFVRRIKWLIKNRKL